MPTTRRAAKRFAPLDPRIANSAGFPQLKGIVFDMDGTLWYVSECVPSGKCFANSFLWLEGFKSILLQDNVVFGIFDVQFQQLIENVFVHDLPLSVFSIISDPLL
jgi:hypothetical protein